MKRIIILPSFEQSIKSLTFDEKAKLRKSLEYFNSFLVSGNFPLGFRFKKINHDKYEFKVGIKLRVIIKIQGGDYYLILVGNHDDVKRYLRRFK